MAVVAEVAGELVGGRYRLIEPVGQGGMGQVWRGRDEILDREVAVKEILLPYDLVPEQRDLLIRRVMREARSAARLNHPGIITVHDVVEHNDAPLIVMEFITGGSLATVIREEGRLRPERVAAIGAAMLDALQEAHAAGIVHRDLKPDNVLITGRRTIITDFGIASMVDGTALTGTGAQLGTPLYMAPEQIEGEPATPASDLWSLGATLYAAVEGQPPFTGPTLTALFNAILIKSPRPAEHAGSLGEILGELLNKDPARRASASRTAQSFATLLEPSAAGRPVQPVPETLPLTGPAQIGAKTSTARAPIGEPGQIPPVRKDGSQYGTVKWYNKVLTDLREWW
jgi:serine/threonine protein kinase